MLRLRYYLPGSMIILFGMLILVFPEILVALVALFLIMLGLGVLTLGHMVRKSETELSEFSSGNSCKDPHPWWIHRASVWSTRCKKPRSFSR
ncbi:MAG: hypothetical protein V2J25_12250 [Desulfatiglans sp.]|jgi:hypothetical protein|nr:hypothetical protein [Thermodesulfobacteriota bacterium]MEE4353632.1 hypothetical protein [Desulfatiglans sp.]